MNATISTSRLRSRIPTVLKAIDRGDMVTITRREKPLAVVVGYDWLTSMMETMEIMSNPEAMQAIRDAEQGKTKYCRLEDIPE